MDAATRTIQGGGLEMDYIINPWWFYFVQVSGTLIDLFCIIGALIFTAGATLWSIEFFCRDSDKKLIARLKRVCIIGAVIFILGTLIPTEDTLIKMQIAKFGTYSNAEKVLEVIDDKTDALIDAIGSVKED